jgi:hypothetical protein
MTRAIDGTAQSYKPLNGKVDRLFHQDSNQQNFRNADTDGDGKLSLGEQLFKEHGVEHSGGKVRGTLNKLVFGAQSDEDGNSRGFFGSRTEAQMNRGQAAQVTPTGIQSDGTVTRSEFRDFVDSRQSQDLTFAQWQRLQFNVAQTFKKLDVNHDGVLDRAEAQRLNADDLNRDMDPPAPAASPIVPPSHPSFSLSMKWSWNRTDHRVAINDPCEGRISPNPPLVPPPQTNPGCLIVKLPIDNPATRNTVEDQIRSFYLNYLHRDPDQEGFNYWLNQVKTNQMTMVQVRTEIQFSPEAKVYGFYLQHLKREPDAGGLAYWRDQIRSGKMTQDQVENAIKNIEDAKKGRSQI